MNNLLSCITILQIADALATGNERIVDIPVVIGVLKHAHTVPDRIEKAPAPVVSKRPRVNKTHQIIVHNAAFVKTLEEDI